MDKRSKLSELDKRSELSKLDIRSKSSLNVVEASVIYRQQEKEKEGGGVTYETKEVDEIKKVDEKRVTFEKKEKSTQKEEIIADELRERVFGQNPFTRPSDGRTASEPAKNPYNADVILGGNPPTSDDYYKLLLRYQEDIGHMIYKQDVDPLKIIHSGKGEFVVDPKEHATGKGTFAELLEGYVLKLRGDSGQQETDKEKTLVARSNTEQTRVLEQGPRPDNQSFGESYLRDLVTPKVKSDYEGKSIRDIVQDMFKKVEEANPEVKEEVKEQVNKDLEALASMATLPLKKAFKLSQEQLLDLAGQVKEIYFHDALEGKLAEAIRKYDIQRRIEANRWKSYKTCHKDLYSMLFIIGQKRQKRRDKMDFAVIFGKEQERIVHLEEKYPRRLKFLQTRVGTSQSPLRDGYP